MPKANRKRGPRQEKKRKRAEAEEAEANASKRPKNDLVEQDPEAQTWDANADFIPLGDSEPQIQDERPFYGLLDEEEQEYFRKAGEMLELNDFPSPEDRMAFVDSVWEQANEKELKLANSQSCSRVLERLIQSSTAAQLKMLFQKFAGNYIPLFQHRFASHCCEKLFVTAAPLVTEELKSRNTEILASGDVKMADLFISVVSEIEPELGYLMNDTFGSHPLRILMLVLSGEPILPTTNKHVLHSRKKESISIMGSGDSLENSLAETREVPPIFLKTLESVIYKTVAGLDTHQLRSLTTHRIGNPILQLLLRLELTKFGKERAKEEFSILHTLLPDETLGPDSPSSSYINGMIYDSVGSRLFEVILEYSPGKTFKALYKSFIKDRLIQLCRSDTASYVVCKALSRVGKEDLQDAIAVLGPEFTKLVDLNRIVVIRTLVERAVARDIDLRPLASHINAAFVDKNGVFQITTLVKVNPGEGEAQQEGEQQQQPPPKKDTKATHISLLLQSLLASPPILSNPVLTSLSTLPPPLLLSLSHSPVHYSLLVAALSPPLLPSDQSQSRTQAPPTSSSFSSSSSSSAPAASTAPLRRKLIAAFYGHYAALALHPTASRVVEAVGRGGTRGLVFMRERVAEELAENAGAMRASSAGRRVWRAWDMDGFKRRRREWVRRSKEEDEAREARRLGGAGSGPPGVGIGSSSSGGGGGGGSGGGSGGGGVASGGYGSGSNGLPIGAGGGSSSSSSSKGGAAGFVGFPEVDEPGRGGDDGSRRRNSGSSVGGGGGRREKEKHMSALERARQRHWREKERERQRNEGKDKEKENERDGRILGT